MTFLFDKKLLATAKIKHFTYYIGTDTYDENVFSYCLIRKCNREMEVLLAKNMTRKEDFDKEVENLMKYFNAEKISETP